MAIEETRAKIVSSIWQSIAQSGVDLQSIPHDQQEKLVEAIANNTMIFLNNILNEIPGPQPATEVSGESEEKVLWQGRPFLSLTENYVITTERIKTTKGLVGRDVENYELIRIQDIDYSQGLSERILGIGDIKISGQDPTDPILVLRNISKPEEVYEVLRKAWLDARKRYGLQFREYM